MTEEGGTRSSRRIRNGDGSSSGKIRPTQVQQFTSYISFSISTTICIGIFIIIYILVLLCASPLLHQKAPQVTTLKHGQVLKPVVSHLGEKVKLQFQNFRKKKDKEDSNLVHKAQKELEQIRKRRVDLEEKDKFSQEQAVAKAAAVTDEDNNQNQQQLQPLDAAAINAVAAQKKPTTGFFVIGMHRSGTSMLSGLLVTGLGYNPGGPLIGSKFDNEKGFFELVDAVLQNDEFMNLQRVWWSANVINYDSDRALDDLKNHRAKFDYGKRALTFMNDPNNAPYMNKDPRMCITFPTWLKILNNTPAILWTYRHPMEVAHSLIHREAAFTLDHALRLWIVYNMRGLQNTKGLCRVYSSNDLILANPLQEVQRLSDELTTKCNVPPPPNELTQEQVNKFVDTNLQHNKKKKFGEDLPVIEEYNDGTCIVHELVTNSPPNSRQYILQKKLYLIAMKLYCDMESGIAYTDDYNEWPVLP